MAEGSSKKNLAIVLGIVVAVVVVVYVIFFLPKGGVPTEFFVYGDEGIPSHSDLYTWDSYREWEVGTGPATFNGQLAGVAGVPEGVECFLTASDNGNTYAGWGVFLPSPTDLSGHNQLKFWVKTAVNLKFGVQQTDANGPKKELYINSYGWDGTDTWQEITVPKSAFTTISFSEVWSPFLVTVVSENESFYVDHVRWV